MAVWLASVRVPVIAPVTMDWGIAVEAVHVTRRPMKAPRNIGLVRIPQLLAISH
jgi:hypothetical protein